MTARVTTRVVSSGRCIKRIFYCVMTLGAFCTLGILIIDSRIQTWRLSIIKHITHPNRNVLSFNSRIREVREPARQALATREMELSVHRPNFKRPKTTHIGFLKIHKAGSTTMQNMFFRFGIKNNLTFAIPNKDNYILNQHSVVAPRKNFSGKFDIFACHSVYSKEFYDYFIPADSVKIGIIREPLERMVSAAYYYRDVFGTAYLKKVPKVDFIKNLIRHPEIYEKSPFSYTKNSMGKDFGFARRIRRNDSDGIMSYLSKLESEISLVMLTECFDESLVLMRRLLNWSTSDIIYMKANSHRYAMNTVSDKDMATFRNTCFLDYAIYDHFKKVLNAKINAQGHEFFGEVKFFQNVLQRLHRFCSSSNITTSLDVESSPWGDAFVVTRVDCRWMKMKELSFISEIRKIYNRGNSLSYHSVL